jgi:hypothetical protein
MAKLQALGRRLSFRFSPLENVYAYAGHPALVATPGPFNGFLKRGSFWPKDQELPLFGLPTADPLEQTAVITFSSKLYTAAKLFGAQKYPDVVARLRFN